jgi:type I restriction enzyme, S subunit
VEGVHRIAEGGRSSVTTETTITRWRDLYTWAPLVGLGTEAPWPLVELRCVVSQVTPEAYDPEPDETVRFAGVRWYGEGLFVREERDGSQIKGKCYPLQPGLLVYNRLFAWKQSFAMVTPQFEGVVVSNEFPQFEVDEKLARTEFVTLICASAKFAEVALMRSTGSTTVSRNRLREIDFLDLEIPLPPLPEQDRIVVQHEADMAAAAVAAEAAQARSSVAWQAFSDALIEPPTEEVRAGGLVSVVRFGDLSRWDKPGGETGLIFRHPEKRLDEIADVRLGVQVPRGNTARQARGGTPYLASRNVRRGHVALTDIRVMDVPESVVEALALRDDDLLFVEGSGSPAEVGRCAMWRGELEVCIHQNSVVRARLHDDTEFLPAFVEAWFNSGPGGEYIREQATTTSGLYHIGAGKLGGAPVPNPDTPTQRDLIAALHGALAVADTDASEARRLRVEARARIEIEVFGSAAEVDEGDAEIEDFEDAGVVDDME